MTDNSKSSRRGSGDYTSQVRELNARAVQKGIGNLNFGDVTTIDVVVRPSLVTEYYATQVFRQMERKVSLEMGSRTEEMPFSVKDMYIYLAILLRERVKEVNKERLVFKPSDPDVRVPTFYHLMLASVGEVVDEREHLWVRVQFQFDELAEIEEQWRVMDALDHRTSEYINAVAAWRQTYKIYFGPQEEFEFCYEMSHLLRLFERFGFVNAGGLPRGKDGDLQFMLFMWGEERLMHPHSDVEPGTSVLASLLAFTRTREILNPYIKYGPDAAFRVLIQELTLPRGGNL